MSCGISKGLVVFGDIGSPDHLNYTVIGATVNLAARLCGCAGPVSIIVTENIYETARDEQGFLFLPREDIKIKGLEKPVTIYELTPLLHAYNKQ